MVLDLIIWDGDVTKGEKMKVGLYTLPDGTKVPNLCPPFPASPNAVKVNEWPNGESDHALMQLREFLPAHFHSDATTMQARLLPTSCETESAGYPVRGEPQPAGFTLAAPQP